MEITNANEVKKLSAILVVPAMILMGGFFGPIVGGLLVNSGHNIETLPNVSLIEILPPCEKDWKPNSGGFVIVTCDETKQP